MVREKSHNNIKHARKLVADAMMMMMMMAVALGMIFLQFCAEEASLLQNICH